MNTPTPDIKFRLSIFIFSIFSLACLLLSFQMAEGCCENTGSLGPVGFKITLGGVISLPDGSPQSGVTGNLMIGDNQVITCTYEGTGAPSDCLPSEMLGTHNSGDPYYSISLSSLLPDIQSLDEWQTDEVVEYAFEYIDPATGKRYIVEGSFTISPGDIDALDQIRFDIQLKEYVAVNQLDETMWLVSAGENILYQDGAIRLDISEAITTAAEIIVEAPTSLTPTYKSGCSGWMRFTNNRGHYAYLTLNTRQLQHTVNSAEWEIFLPSDGNYEVSAYIFSHSVIQWNCGGSFTINWDTIEAPYQIAHAGGLTNIYGDQKLLENEWLSLGTYEFNAADKAVVRLSDLNTQPDFTETISFSAIRFVRTDVPPDVITGTIKTQPITPIAETAVWHTHELSLTIPSSTSAYLTLLDESGDPISRFSNWPLVDGLNQLDLSDLSHADYPTIQTQVDFQATGTGHIAPQLTGWSLSWLAGSSAVSHHTSGTVVDGLNNVIPYAHISLLENGVSIAETMTNMQGQYVFGPDVPIYANESYQVRVTLKDALLDPPRFQLRDATNSLFDGDTPYLQTEPFMYSDDSPIISQRHFFDFGQDGNRYQTNVSNPDHLQHMAVSFREAGRAADFVYHGLGERPDTVDVNIFAGGAYASNVAYYEAEKAVVIGQNHALYDNPNMPMNREWHEIIHDVHGQQVGFPTSYCYPNNNHGGYDNCDTSDSLIEGLAIFGASVTADWHNLSEPEFYRYGTARAAGAVSLEFNWEAWDRACEKPWCHSREEFAVAGIFWDLYDDTVADDMVDLSITEIWSILKDPTINTMKDVYDRLQDAGVGQIPGKSGMCDLDALDEIFVLHGFFVDQNGNQNYECGEEVGRAADSGRPGRGNVPATPHYLHLSAGQTRSPIKTGNIQIGVNFLDDPSQNYIYTPTVGINGLLIIEPLPIDVRADIVVVYIENNVAQQILTFRNEGYAALIAQETEPGTIVMSHTFGEGNTSFSLPYRVHMPLLIR